MSQEKKIEKENSSNCSNIQWNKLTEICSKNCSLSLSLNRNNFSKKWHICYICTS